jgi:hypothetical protein
MTQIIQTGTIDGHPVFGYAPDTCPLAVGDVLHGFCGGYFGRDHYDCCVIEAVGPDWIVTRALDRDDYGTGLDFAAGREDLAQLRQYRTPTTKPADGITPCCAVTA